MTCLEKLEIVANVAAILTACAAAFWSAYFSIDRTRKRWRLECHLKKEKEKKTDKGQRTILHCMAKTGMTQDEVLRSAFHSSHINTLVKEDEKGYASDLLLEYVDVRR